MMRSISGCKPVISMSIQTSRLASCAIIFTWRKISAYSRIIAGPPERWYAAIPSLVYRYFPDGAWRIAGDAALACAPAGTARRRQSRRTAGALRHAHHAGRTSEGGRLHDRADAPGHAG